MKRIAVCIVNYKMGERTDALVEHILETCKFPHDFYVIDVMDKDDEHNWHSKYATSRLPFNPQMNKGLTAAVLDATVGYGKNMDYLAFWFITTSMFFIEGDKTDIMTPMAQKFLEDRDAVILSPALDQSSGTAWTNMKTKGGSGWRQTHGCDALATMYRAKWFLKQGGYNPHLTYGWGMDMEMSWKARGQEKTIWINEDVRMHKEESIAHTMGRWKFTPEERRVKAREEMYSVLTAKYGAEFIEKLMWEWWAGGRL